MVVEVVLWEYKMWLTLITDITQNACYYILQWIYIWLNYISVNDIILLYLFSRRFYYVNADKRHFIQLDFLDQQRKINIVLLVISTTDNLEKRYYGKHNIANRMQRAYNTIIELPTSRGRWIIIIIWYYRSLNRIKYNINTKINSRLPDTFPQYNYNEKKVYTTSITYNTHYRTKFDTFFLSDFMNELYECFVGIINKNESLH